MSKTKEKDGVKLSKKAKSKYELELEMRLLRREQLKNKKDVASELELARLDRDIPYIKLMLEVWG